MEITDQNIVIINEFNKLKVQSQLENAHDQYVI